MQSTYTVNSNTNVTSDISDDTVLFNVGGQIFEIQRTLLNKFPDTIIARSASDLWNKSIYLSDFWNKSSDVTPSVQTSNEEKCAPTKPIFIDRDSIRFGYILDYMHDSGTVALPVTIPRDTFMKELEYYGFDIETINNDCISCTIPIFDTFQLIDQLHEKYRDMVLVHDVRVFAYACYCDLLAKKSLEISINMQWSHNEYQHYVPEYLLAVNTKLIKGSISGKSVVNAIANLWDAYEKQTAADPMHPTIRQFNQDLSEYGFECNTFKCTTSITSSHWNTKNYTVDISLKKYC